MTAARREPRAHSHSYRLTAGTTETLIFFRALSSLLISAKVSRLVALRLNSLFTWLGGDVTRFCIWTPSLPGSKLYLRGCQESTNLRQVLTDVMSGPITASLASPSDEILCGARSVGFDARFCGAHGVRYGSGARLVTQRCDGQPQDKQRSGVCSVVEVKYALQCLPSPLPEVARHYLG
jgi:hypothetical protein